MEHDNAQVLSPESILTVHRNKQSGAGRPAGSKTVADVLMHPSAMSFCDEAMREKLLLLREYRRFQSDTGLLKPTDPRSNNFVPPKHPLLAMAHVLITKSNYDDTSPSVAAKLLDRAAQIISQVQRSCHDISQSYVDNQLKMVRLAQQGSTDGPGLDGDPEGMDDDVLLEEARKLGLDIPEELLSGGPPTSPDADEVEEDDGL